MADTRDTSAVPGGSVEQVGIEFGLLRLREMFLRSVEFYKLLSNLSNVGSFSHLLSFSLRTVIFAT